MNKILLMIIAAALLAGSCSKEKRSQKAGVKMQDFIVDISNYSRGLDGDFIVIPQNGHELLFSDLEISNGLDERVKGAVSAIGIEELYYNGTYIGDEERIAPLKTIRAGKPVLVSEYVNNNADVKSAIDANKNQLFIPFVRTSENYDYKFIPDTIVNENAMDVNGMYDVKNYLYLISTDGFASKEAYLNAIRQTNYDLVIIDLFHDGAELSSAEVASLKIKQNGGKRLVISYISIGSAESYRYYFKDNWKEGKPNWIKKKYEGYEDEYWVKFWKKDWQEIIYGNDDSYIKKIINAGFDGAYLDNVEAYYFLYYND